MSQITMNHVGSAQQLGMSVQEHLDQLAVLKEQYVGGPADYRV